MKILSAGQSVAVAGPNRGKVECHLTVLLDDGSQAVILTSEETVNRIIELMAGIGPASDVRQDYRAYVDDVEVPVVGTPKVRPAEDSAAYFGGNGDGPSLGAIAEEPHPERAPAPGIGQAAPRARTVDKDEMGYPIVQRAEQPSNEVFEEEDPGEQI